MSRWKQRRWTGIASRMVGAPLRLCLGFWLVLQIVYTPIHLYRVPHSDEADFGTAAPQTAAGIFAGDEGHGHHERHSAAQHKFKVLRPERAALPEVFLAPTVACVVVRQDCPLPEVFEFSGLSPPELLRCWQFLVRAALPVRAPSCLS